MAVTILDYEGHAMEPFISRDGLFLFFNNENDPLIDTNLFYANRIDDFTFRFQGQVQGLNTAENLEAVPSMDSQNRFFFVSDRDYRPETHYSTLYYADFQDGNITDIRQLQSISLNIPHWLNFDGEISMDGQFLYYNIGFYGTALESAYLKVAQWQDNLGFVPMEDSDTLLFNVNSDTALEYAPSISTSGLELFFTRYTPEEEPALQIMISRRDSLTASFGEPVRIEAIQGFVEAPSLSYDGTLLYYHRKDNLGMHSIYCVSRHRIPQ